MINVIRLELFLIKHYFCRTLVAEKDHFRRQGCSQTPGLYIYIYILYSMFKEDEISLLCDVPILSTILYYISLSNTHPHTHTHSSHLTGENIHCQCEKWSGTDGIRMIETTHNGSHNFLIFLPIPLSLSSVCRIVSLSLSLPPSLPLSRSPSLSPSLPPVFLPDYTHHPGLFNAIQAQGSCQRGWSSLEAPQRNTKSAKRGTRGGRSTRRRRKVEGRGRGGGGGGGKGSGVAPPPTGKHVPISAGLFLAPHMLSGKYQWLLPKVSGIKS